MRITSRGALLVLITALLGAVFASWLFTGRTAPPVRSSLSRMPSMAATDLQSQTGQDSAKPDAVSVERRAVGVAATAASPYLTFEGYLSDRLQRALPDEDQAAPQFGEPPAEHVVLEKRWNPEGKELTADQFQALCDLLRGQRERDGDFARANRRLTRTALMRAVETGQFVVREMAPIVASDPVELARQTQLAATSGQRAQREMMAELTARHGQPMRDWAYSSCGTSEPDGVARQTIVYFTRGDAPDVFACREEWAAAKKANEAALRQFFASLP